ncbi:hypothetical protein D9M68_966720 [compost metagenome]
MAVLPAASMIVAPGALSVPAETSAMRPSVTRTLPFSITWSVSAVKMRALTIRISAEPPCATGTDRVQSMTKAKDSGERTSCLRNWLMGSPL